MNLIQNCLAHLREVDDLTDLLSIHVVEMVPLKLSLFLDLASNVVEMHHLSELAEGCHGAPQTLLYHLTHVQHHLAKVSPSTLETNLEKRSHDSTCALSDVDHVCIQVVALHLEA